MTQSWRGWRWTGVVAGFTIPVLLWADCAVAQRRPVADETLGNERSIVTPAQIRGRPSDRITGGAQRGSNLFHSFQEFSIDEGRAAYFDNPAGVENILGRVTGGGRSEIFGRLGVLGNANLFLINPNGIIFGENVSLDVRGSFVGTTANAMQFGSQGFFSASQPNAPSVLVVSPSAFLFNQIAAQPINSIEDRGVLRVPANQSLLLVGGNVAPTIAAPGNILIDNGLLRASDGRVELAGVSDQGVIELEAVGTQFRLRFPNNVARSDISLVNGAAVNTSGSSGGSIQVYGRSIMLSEAAQIFSNTQGSGTGGDLNIDASELVELSRTTENGITGLSTQVADTGAGTAGNLTIRTRRLIIQSGAQISTGVFGVGTGGNLDVNATNSIEISDVLDNGFPSGLFTEVAEDGRGDSGNLTIQTRQLRLRNGAEISSSNFSGGTGGNVSIIATDFTEVSGFRVGSQVANNPQRLILPSVITTSTRGRGDAGDLTLQTRQLLVQDRGQIITESSRGIAGDLTLQTDQLIIRDRGRISASTLSSGTGGSLRVDTRQLLMQNGAGLGAVTLGDGDGGDVLVRATDSVQIIGGQAFSALVATSQSKEATSGDAGDLEIQTRRLLLQDGAQIGVETLGGGNGGNLTVVATDLVQINGTQGIEGAPSGLFAATEGTGDAGNLTVQTRQLAIRDGGRVSAGTFGRSSQGNGGSLIIRASDSVQVIGVAADGQRVSLLTAQTEGTGDAGDLIINTERLQVQNGARVSVSGVGSSRAGNLRINTRVASLNNRSSITAATESGVGGNIELQISDSLRLSDRSVISASTQGGQSGSLTLNANRVAADTVQLNNSQLLVQANGNGIAGSINLNTGQLMLHNGAAISATTVSGQQGGDITLQGLERLQVTDSTISASTQTGRAGSLTVSAAGSVQLSGRSGDDSAGLSVQATGDRGRAGSLIIRADELSVSNGATISASTTSGRGGSIRLEELDHLRLNEGQISASTQSGRGGNLTVNARQLTVRNGDSAITAASRSGIGGNVEINAEQVSVQNRAEISASTNTGQAGRLSVNATDSIELDNQGRLAVQAQGNNATAGDLNVTTDRFTATNGASATVSSPQGQAGNVVITANSVQLDHSRLTAETQGRGGESGATIKLQSLDSLILQNRSLISAQARGNSRGGNVVIDSNFIVAPLGQDNDIVASAARGRGGNIQITTQGLFGLEEQNIGNTTNDIDASSQLGVQGTVTINRPDVDPSRGLTELPIAPVDASNQIAQTCPTRGSRTVASALDEFVVTGRGGLPTSPIDPLNSDEPLADWAALDSEQPNSAIDTPAQSTANPSENSVVEATAWRADAAGKIALIAEAPTADFQIPGSTSAKCQ